MKFGASAILALAALVPSTNAAAAQCGYDATLTNDAPAFESDPITIDSQNGDEVTFTVSQTWSDELLCLIATNYVSDEGNVCPSVANAAPGEFAQYTAKCVDGIATVDLYVYDPTLLDNTDSFTIADICEQTDLTKTYKYQFEIPCDLGDPEVCPPVEPSCADLVYEFDSTDDVDAWLFGKQGTSGSNSFLALDTSTAEVSKTVDVPSSATGVTFEFDFLTIGDKPAGQKLLARIGDYYINLTEGLGLTSSSKTYFFGTIEATVEPIVFTNTKTVKVTIPAELYSKGFISLGVKTTADSTFSAGVDNMKVTFACDGSDPGFLEGEKAGGGGGDPHFQRWGREHSSFHGECDLVMVHSEDFHKGAGLDLHVRTTIQDYFSYIETAALRVGKNIIEFHKNHFFLDGTMYTVADLPMTFGGEFSYTISNAEIEEGKNAKFYQYFKVDLHEDSSILFKFYKQYLTIAVAGHAKDFSTSTGLLGDYFTGDMIDREGKIITDADQWGFEWQVSPDDGKLFLDDRAPQLPFEQCRMPTAARPARRKLRGADMALFETAKAACSHVSGSDFDLCTDDIMATGDVGLASVW